MHSVLGNSEEPGGQLGGMGQSEEFAINFTSCER